MAFLMSDVNHWLGRIRKLSVYRAKGGAAPHKPLLLLVILEMAEQGQLPAVLLPLSAELAFRFFTFWNIVASRRTQRPDVRLPFYHLQSDGFWESLDEAGKPAASFKLARTARLDPQFVALAGDPSFRRQARRLLIAGYFLPDEQVALATLVGLPVSDIGAMESEAEEGPEEARKKGREARFRLQVVAAYNYTCALTRYRLTTLTAGSIVDAAHIHQFARSRNNDPQNGLALCKNAHWLFDNGLWTLTDDCKVMVATGRFSEESPDQKALAAYDGQTILLPVHESLRPSPAFLAWHRKHKFQSG
jgi:putative restriction endonuclease